MAFSKVSDVLSAAAGHMASSRSVSRSSSSSGLLPPAGPDLGFSTFGSGQKNNLRYSSSLQDFSTYHGLDPDEGNLDLVVNRTASRGKVPYALQRESAGASLSKEKSFPGIPFVWKKWTRVIMALIFLLLLFFLFSLCAKYLSTYWSQETSKFYVVLDCGSTGTRVYVYQSSIDHKKDGNLPIILRSLPEGTQRKSIARFGRAYLRLETEPGFDKLVHNTSGLKAAIKPLLRWAEKQIPKSSLKSTSLFLYATAGVRRLPSSDSQWLLDNAWSILENSSFLCQRDRVRIITGMEEAYYGWIALNYNMGMLGSEPTKATFGALDLGGSSLQVTFETKEQVQGETGLNLNIGAVNHQLSAYSLSGFGLNEAFDKSVVYLLKTVQGISNADLINGEVELKHPCLQSGYTEKYFCSRCASLNQESGSPLMVGENIVEGGKPGITVRLVGVPRWEDCSALAKVAVNLSEWSDSNTGINCELQPCALSDSLPRPHGKFYAMSGFFVVFRFFNLSSEATLDDVLDKGQEFCGKSWDVARNSVVPQSFIEQYCFRVPYIVLLLREGLHITDSQVLIGSGSITWTLGVALLEAGGSLSTRMPLQSYRILRMKISPTILIVLVFISLVLLACALSCIGDWMLRFFRRPYLPLFRHNSTTATSVLNMSSPFRFQRWSPINTGKLFSEDC
ncbi:probable apyrase 7 [Macadamia integrifolia]|uniref:probable apyrase 7 n=1 Tax=Macadamia integrifolia TaxID=60698 RepID=UPI001C4E363E|nr:probable apyrase 7 [Macadamia integrifolia]XP_042489978.1 probable apyrase 7 [Macadamia integrifolia]XP_042489979.1 probable apyrase 7 [Macadamia integrifolia]XP_042489980.1 probable apyrase 7 [Macadamia integrifolia]XP_042489981.1 probable apyrase 7 [Macadamia integrifolia]